MSFLGVLFCADVLVSSTSIGVCVGSIVKVGVDRSERFLRSISDRHAFQTWQIRQQEEFLLLVKEIECAKFRGSRVVVGLVGLVPSCLLGISWVQNIFLWVFRGSQIFSRGYFVGLKFFLVGILWV